MQQRWTLKQQNRPQLTVRITVSFWDYYSHDKGNQGMFQEIGILIASKEHQREYDCCVDYSEWWQNYGHFYQIIHSLFDCLSLRSSNVCFKHRGRGLLIAPFISTIASCLDGSNVYHLPYNNYTEHHHFCDFAIFSTCTPSGKFYYELISVMMTEPASVVSPDYTRKITHRIIVYNLPSRILHSERNLASRRLSTLQERVHFCKISAGEDI